MKTIFYRLSQNPALQAVGWILIIGICWQIVFAIVLPAWGAPTWLIDYHGWVFIVLVAWISYYSLKWPLEKNREISRALLRNEAKYRALVEEINEVIFMIDHLGRIRYISPAVKALTGYDPKELMGQSFIHYIAPEDEDRVMRAFKERLANDIRPLQFRLVCKDGKIKWVRSLSRPYRNQKGERGIRGVLMDISDLMKMDQALRESEARWRSVVEQAPDYIVITDANGKVAFVNRTFFDVAEAQVRGQMIYDLVPQKEMNKVYRAIQKVQESLQTQRFEIGIELGSKKRYYYVNVGPVLKDGYLTGLTFIASDISRRKIYEEELQQYRMHLQDVVNKRTRQLMSIKNELYDFNRVLDKDILQLAREIDLLIDEEVNKKKKIKSTELLEIQVIQKKFHDLYTRLKNLERRIHKKS